MLIKISIPVLNAGFSWFGTHFDDMPEILTYRQISPNFLLHTNCSMEITVSQAVGQVDLRNHE